MHFLLAALGSIGDVVPVLEIGRVLQRRGHDVQVLANPVFEAHVRKADLEFVPAGRKSDQERVLSHPQCWSRLRGWTLWLRMVCVPTMRPMYEAIERLHRPGETVLAYGWGCFGARIAAETLGAPAASLYLEPDKFRSARETAELPLAVLSRDWHPAAVRRFVYWFGDRAFVDHFLYKVNRFRKELGLPQQKRLLHRWWNGPDLALGLFPDWWGQPQPDWPKQAEITGFPYGELSTSDRVSPELDRFLDEGEPPIVFTPGALNRQSRDFFHVAAQTCQQLGSRGVLLGDPAAIPATLPDGVRHFDYAPFNDLFPRSSLVVHRAGIGTAVQAMAAARPQVVLPTLYLHHDTARRLERLGVSSTVAWKGLNADRLVAAIRSLQGSPHVRRSAEETALRIREGTPIEDTCDLLERLRPARAVETRATVSSHGPETAAAVTHES